MVSELRDIRDFLARHPPFAALPAKVLDELPRLFSVRYLRRGSRFPPQDGDTPGLLMLRKGAVELRDGMGVLHGKLAEGDSYDAAVEGESCPDDSRVVEDSLVYVLPARSLEQLRRANPEFGADFERSLNERLLRARDAVHVTPPVGGNLMRLTVGDLLARDPVTARPDSTVGEAAELMTRERVSSLLVVEGGRLTGILTDRDLRSRCVAQARDSAARLEEVMTPDPHTISGSASAFEALLAMSRLRVHHLPVVDDGRLAGLVSTQDLLRAQSSNPLYLADRIGRFRSVDELKEASVQTRELQLQLVAAHATATQLGQAVTTVADALTRRLIELAIERLGEPPVPFVWIATGSQGRSELTLHSDQDNSMILDDRYDPKRHADYYESLARFVNDGLDACGYANCPGEVMASNPRWRQPLDSWRGYFSQWLEHTDHKAATLAANFFDMRGVWGEDSLRGRLMADVLQRCPEEEVFLAYMAAHALANRPPLGFFRGFVLVRSGEHEGTVDLKMHGLLPIVDLARVFALRAGVGAVATLQRLAKAAGTGCLSPEGAEGLQAAFEFLWTLRARHQAGQLRRGEPIDNYVAPDALTPIERRHLKDAFTAIARMHEAVRSTHGDRLPL
ncbi:MAG TPA: putative nucleotidyltransferase substrate binding domain-containing protein [Steroidobacteraceae bacterium]|nr:putative nucleotidyltransferase substrate binding domain-containing protein [Steroidobacteraceae bacterium]